MGSLMSSEWFGWVLGSDGTTEMVISLSIWSFILGFFTRQQSQDSIVGGRKQKLQDFLKPGLQNLHIGHSRSIHGRGRRDTLHLSLEGAAKTFVTIPPWYLHLQNTQRKQSPCRNWEGKARKIKEEPWRVKSRSQAMDCCKNGRERSQYRMLWSGQVRSVPKMAIGFGS